MVFLKAQQDLQPRLLRRPRRLGPVRPVGAAGACTSSRPTTSSWRRCCCGCAGGVLWFVALVDRRGMLAIVAVAVLSAAVHYVAPQRARHPRSSRCRTTRASPTRASSPTAQRIYERASPFGYLRDLFQLLPAFRAGPLRQRRLQPAEHAGQRLSRHVHRFGEGPSGIIKDLPDERDGVFPLPADVSTPMS